MTPSTRVLLKDVAYTVTFIAAIVFVGIIWNKFYKDKDERVAELEKFAPFPPVDVWKTNPLPDGTFETFRKVQYDQTLVYCYSVVEPEGNKTRFSSCRFVPQQSSKFDNH